METFKSSQYVLSLIVLLSVLLLGPAYAAPGHTTYQARIIKPDGLPLEGVNVSFRFTILDPSATCVLYVENYSAVNMSDGGGLVSFSLGMGTRTFPVSGTSSTFSNTFDNSTASFNCQTAGTYNPVVDDNRKVVMQFNDGNGWQTLPAMAINAVPYSMYAGKSENSLKLNGKADSAFVEYSTLAGLSCAADQAIKFNGVSFSCITVGSGGGGGITGVTTSGTVLSTGGTASAPVISIQAATMSQDGYLTSLDYAEFKGKLSASSTQIANTLGFAPVSAAAVTAQINSSSLSGDVSGTFSTASVLSVGGKTASQISASVDATLAATASNTANTLVKRDSSGNFIANDISANSAKINYADIYKPSTSFNIRLQAPTSLSTSYILNLPTTSGTTGQVLSTDGSGNLSWVNPSTGSVTSVSATGPLASTGGSTPTISIAQATSTTAGYLSSADWNTFNNKQAATSAAIIATLGYTPANSAAVVSSQWTTSGSDIHYATGNVGIGTSSPAHRLDVAGGSLANDTSIYFTQLNSASAKFNAVQLDPYVATATAGSETTGLSIGTKTGGTTTWSVDFSDNIYTYVPINANAGSTFLNRNVSSSSAHSLAFYKRRTAGSVLANDNLAWIPGYGHTGSAWASTYSAAIGIRATENISATAAGGQLWFETTPNGTITPQNRMVIDQNGNVGIGTINPTAKLHLAAGTASTAPFKFTSGTLLTAPQSGTMEYDGANFYLTDSTNTRRAIATGSSAATIDNISTINSTGSISLVPTGSVVVSSTTASTNSSTGALVVKGGLGVAGNIYTSGTIITSSNIQGSEVTAASATITPYIYGSTASGGSLRVESTTHATKGNILLGVDGGNVGIGTNAPLSKLHVSGTLTIDNNSSNARIDGRNGLDIYSTTGGAGVLAKFKQGSGNPSPNYLTLANINPGFGPTLSVDGSDTNISMDIRPKGTGSVNFPIGNVGIGTTSPRDKLEISGANPYVILAGTEGGAKSRYIREVAGALAFGEYGVATHMTIDVSGNVGIGTTSPASKLDVYDAQQAGSNGTVQIKQDAATNNPTLKIVQTVSGGNPGVNQGLLIDVQGTSSGDANALNVRGQGTSRFVVQNGGNVGIGTTSPTNPLHVTTSNNFSTVMFESSGSEVNVGFKSTSSGGRDWRLVSGGSGGSYANGLFGVYDVASATARMVFTPAGNVGIGTATPGTKLEVVGDARILASSADAEGVKFHTAYSNNETSSRIALAERQDDAYGWSLVAAGVLNPVLGGTTLTGLPAGTFSIVRHSASTAGSAAFTINRDNGNVGIATTSPALTLDVSGSVRSRPVAVATTVTSIDWSSGNIQYTPDSCGSFVFNNIADGAAYTFVVKGATAATCNITFYSGNGSGALTAHFTPANAATTASTHTAYTFFRAGNDVYISWASGL